MVRPLCDEGVGSTAPFVSKRFRLDAITGKEVLRISALGLYIAFINGRRIGEDLLTPGWTSYDKRLSYQAYDVGDLLNRGENHIEIWLADGWLRSRMMWGDEPILNTWGDRLAAIAELRSFPDSPDPVLVTDGTWSSGLLPILKSGIYFGEIFDARVSPEASHGVEAMPFDLERLIPCEARPVRELEAVPVVKQWRDAAGRLLYDFGQNLGGYVSFEVLGAPGAKVVVEHAEILDEEGEFYNENYRTADARIEYVLNGSGREAYKPHFTFQGFRYARVSVLGQAEVLNIVAIPISSVSDVKASFTCGNQLVNRLVQNTIWSQRANFIEVPTDCPQRDERLGWTGDAQVFAGTALYLADVHRFFKKWIRDVMADQRDDGAIPHVVPDPTRLHPENFPGFFGSTGWGDAIWVIPWQLYLHHGDRDFLAEVLPAMVKWVDFVWSISDGPIVRPPRTWGARGFSFGDWLQPSGPSAKPLPTISDEAAATLYLYIASSHVARIAAIVGDVQQADRLRDLADEVKRAFAREFITPSGRVAGDDQTSYALAFLHDLIPCDRVEAAKEHFKNAISRTDGRIGTGFIGTPALLPALIKISEPGLAGQMFLQEEVPGWLYQVKMGATTIWERWDAVQPDGKIYNPQMNSYNHYAYGAVCQWLIESVSGFRPDEVEPGFAKIVFEPSIIANLSPVRAHHECDHGTIRAEWTESDGHVTYDIEVPEGSTGVLRLSPSYTNAMVDGNECNDASETLVGPGRHRVTFDWTPPAVFASALEGKADPTP
ncbi:family 78 glycoside hydrolase catalytic domain [Devosia rhodophyticola]|uniref:alpha-L-rhamnosidase n=2 Tax=Devosia rhodophyticola TaxID=3026423 RepID=A0ABY7Z1Q8_9HYPH|nr:alpha-L-rhamnosidase [Devosia rhodophyticola]WDR07610.1 family 78 glycoside hydrolase catalytic domain [Devosia rhodophyticola]